MLKPEGAEILRSSINDHSRVCKKMAIGEERLDSFFRALGISIILCFLVQGSDYLLSGLLFIFFA